MSVNYFHVHIYKTDQKKVAEVLDIFMKERGFFKKRVLSVNGLSNFHFKVRKDERIFIVTDRQNEWLSLYGSIREDELMECAKSISGNVNSKVWWFMVYEGDVFLYNLFDKGELVAEYNSCPNYFEERVSNREIIESKEDSALLAKLFPFLKKYQTKIKLMLTQGWIISQKDFERDSKYLDPVILMNDFATCFGIKKSFLNVNYSDFFIDHDFIKTFRGYQNFKILIYRQKSYLWIWLIILLFVFSGKLYKLLLSF